MLRTTRSTTFCSRKPFLKVNTGRAKSSCGTSASIRWSDRKNPTQRPRSATASCDSPCMARNFGENGQSQKTRMGTGTRENWLLQKIQDEFAEEGYDPETQPASALSGKVPRGKR